MPGNSKVNRAEDISRLVQAEHKPFSTTVDDEVPLDPESFSDKDGPCPCCLSSPVHRGHSSEDMQATFVANRITGENPDPVSSARDAEIEDFPGTSRRIRKSELGTAMETEKTPKPLGQSPGIAKNTPRKRNASFAIFVYKVMKQVHPTLGITKKAMKIMDSLVSDTFERITENAVKLPSHSEGRTITSRDIEAAVKSIMPGELATHGGADANKAVSTYLKFQSNK